MTYTKWGTTTMCIGYICRFSRRNGINAWSWLFETIASVYPDNPHSLLMFQLILLSPCLFLAQDYVALPRVTSSLNANELLPLPRRALITIYIVADIITVLTQLAGTALSITFGDLVSIGKKVG